MQARTTIVIAVLACAVLIMPTHISAQIFEKEGTFPGSVLEFVADARAVGMGGAFVAISEGPLATIWNPAGLVIQNGISVQPVAYRDLNMPSPFDSIKPWYYTAAAAVGVDHFGFGFAYNRFDPGINGVLRSIYRDIDEVDLTETAFQFGAAFDLGGFLDQDDRLLASFGTTTKRVDIREDIGGWEWDIGTIIGYRFAPHGVGVLPRVGVSVRNIVDGAFERSGQSSMRLDRAALLGASVEILPPWKNSLGSLLRVLASFQADSFYGDLNRKPIIRSGSELTAFELISGRLGVRWDNDSRERFMDFGVGLGYRRWKLGRHSLGLQFDFASVDSAARSEVYGVTASIGL